MPTDNRPDLAKPESLKDLARRAASVAQNSNLVSINLFSIRAEFPEDAQIDEDAELELANEHRVEHVLTPETPEEPAKLIVSLHFSVRIKPVSAEDAAFFELLATFHAHYVMNRGMPDEARADLDAFAQTNAVVHTWPYFRELVQSTIWRCGLPPFPLPLFRITDQQPASTFRREKQPLNQ